MKWDQKQELKNQNKMWFNMYKPNEIQHQMLVQLANVKEDYNNCGLLGAYSNEEENDDTFLFILTHPWIEEIVNTPKGDISVHLPLGYIMFTSFPEYKFIDKNGNTYSVIYVDSRCSFGLWPEFKSVLKTISDIEKTKVNIGQILNQFLEGFARKFKTEQGTDYTILFNMSLATAVFSHKKFGWEEDVLFPFNRIKDVKTGELAYNTFVKTGMVDPEHEYHMYKVIK